MSEFATQMPFDRFTEYVLHTREKVGKSLHNIVSLEHPIWKKLEASSGISREEVGRPVVEDVRYETHNRTVTLTRNNGLKDTNLVENKGVTRVWYDWQILVPTFMINYWDYHTTTSGAGMQTLIKQRMEGLEEGLQDLLTQRLWNGHAEDGVMQWGLKHFMRANVAADPAEGPIGALSVTRVPSWANQVINFNAPAIDWVSGASIVSFLGGSNSWSEMWQRCTNNTSAAGQPDLIAVNDKMALWLDLLVQARLINYDAGGTKQLGTEAYRYKSASVYFDRDMPVQDPAKGEARFINTRSIGVVYGQGMEKKWGPIERIPGKTAFSQERMTAWTVKANNLRMNGYWYGATAPEAA